VTDTKTPLGAHPGPEGVIFGVWSTRAKSMHVVIDDFGEFPLEPVGGAVFAGTVSGIGARARYRFRIDDGDAFPDPRSRFQPTGVHGPSEVVDPGTFMWTNTDWPRLSADELVIYELHVGTFTPEGTFRAAIERLPELASLGVTAIELMPVADFPGERNWGYDAVSPFAPARCYGSPDDLRTLVDAAHGYGLGVILDVVYNHLGPDGNYLRVYSDEYFTHKHLTPWGDAINYDGPGSQQVRDFVIDNAVGWVRDFHVDGFRFDATEQIVDSSDRHILAEIGLAARAATDRPIVLVAEEARNLVRVVHDPAEGGWGLDASWADDFHHVLKVRLTGIRDHYYADYQGTLSELAATINEGFLYQGQISGFRSRPRGTRVTDEPASSFVFCIQNHDQVGNQPFGERLHHDIDRDRYATASALLLFLPQTVLLFMGQEFLASTPFLFFTDHHDELGQLVTKGRRQEFSGLRGFGRSDMTDSIPDPQAESTFTGSKLNWVERERNAGMVHLYAAMLRLRREDPVLRVSDRARTRAEGQGADILTVRRWTNDQERVLVANFGRATEVEVAALAGDDAAICLLCTAEQRFGGTGAEAVVERRDDRVIVQVPARSAVLLATATAAETGDR
jgi:maltooligosyltrehalose trehalohydrolase